MLAFLLVSRALDMISTRIATPNLVLEGNPIAKALGWRWGIPINTLICFVMAFWALPAVVFSTTSALVAARNFQSAWLMRSLGENVYCDWHVQRVQETPITLYLLCLAGNTMLTAAVGATLIYFSEMKLVPFGIGVGIVAYGGAVAVFTLLGVLRRHHATVRVKERVSALQDAQIMPRLTPANKLMGIYIGGGAPPQGK